MTSSLLNKGLRLSSDSELLLRRNECNAIWIFSNRYFARMPYLIRAGGCRRKWGLDNSWEKRQQWQWVCAKKKIALIPTHMWSKRLFHSHTLDDRGGKKGSLLRDARMIFLRVSTTRDCSTYVRKINGLVCTVFKFPPPFLANTSTNQRGKHLTFKNTSKHIVPHRLVFNQGVMCTLQIFIDEKL